MKTRIEYLLGLLLLALAANAQRGINYKAIINDDDGNLLASTAITVQFTILENGTNPVYSETHNITTDANGILIVNIGEGSTSDNFIAIDWSGDPLYLKTEIDKGEGFVDMGTTEFKTVPYALHAKTAESVAGGITETDPVYTASQSVNITATDIANLGNLSGTNTGDQNLSINGSNLSISGGNTVSLTAIGGGSSVPVYSNAEILALTPTQGDAVFNSTELLYQVYDGTSWQVFNTNCWPQPTSANAGSDQTINDGTLSTTLAANAPETAHGTGVWTIVSGTGGSFADATDPSTTFSGVENISYTLRWTITTNCDNTYDELSVVFVRIDAGPALTDVDGNSYNTVWIGEQLWMAENLKTTKYNDGTSIPLEWDAWTWSNLNTPAYCWYNNDEATGNTYGALYNWYTVSTGNLCPAGWHVPTDAEWTMLTTYLGGENVAGGKLKEIGTSHWNSPNTGATNETGFTAVPGGYRHYYDGSFGGIGDYGVWWSATQTHQDWATLRSVGYDRSNVHRDANYYMQYGLSVRCLRD
jgi:uncharacterized protein (TIGR02145 family)